MSAFGGFGKPGQGAAAFTSEREIVAQGFDANLALYKSIVVSGATRDAGNTPTTVLRPGLLLGRLTSGSEYEDWDPAATDGTQNIGAVLWKELRAQDFDANNVDRVFTAFVGRAFLQASQLLIQGVALVGHADEYLARRQMVTAGFVLDDDPFSYKAGAGYRTIVKAADYTVVGDDNGTYFTTRGAAGAVNFTLPALKRGLSFEFFNEAGQNMTITAATADTMVTFNDLAADSIAFSTASELIGAKVKVRANDDASKWLVEVNLGAETQTPTIAT